ncbi:MAG: SGNH/GDSL hydrolase family protein [Clostridia bacterium]|nr:SGNH/GDSL hydrolase family protein [Clostridia bacterium]
MELKGLKINFLGDSITEGHGASDNSKCYVSLMASKYGVIARNYGIGGTRIAVQKNPSEWAVHDKYFGSRVEEMDKDADMIFVFGGTNDFGHGDAAIGTPDDRTEETFYGAFHCLCTKLIEKYPTSKIIILTPLHRLNEDSPTGDAKLAPVGVLKDYVNIIREVAEYYSLPVLDLYATSGMQPKIPVIQQMYMPDGLHPSDAGYELLADQIAAYIKSL